MRVLLVDDERHFVSALAERLNMRGIPTDWACDGQEAMEKAEKNQYDLAILDVKMPNLSGIDLKRMLMRIAPEMRFIFFTGHGSEEDFKVGSAEAVSYLVKPLRIDELIEKIQAALAPGQQGDKK